MLPQAAFAQTNFGVYSDAACDERRLHSDGAFDLTDTYCAFSTINNSHAHFCELWGGGHVGTTATQVVVDAHSFGDGIAQGSFIFLRH